MQQLKLGNYRKYMKEISNQSGLTRLEMELLMWGHQQEFGFSQSEAIANVAAAMQSILMAFRKLHRNGYLKYGRERRRNVSRIYTVTVKGRHLIQKFYNKFLFD